VITNDDDDDDGDDDAMILTKNNILSSCHTLSGADLMTEIHLLLWIDFNGLQMVDVLFIYLLFFLTDVVVGIHSQVGLVSLFLFAFERCCCITCGTCRR
jgi:hypothetical protein